MIELVHNKITNEFFWHENCSSYYDLLNTWDVFLNPFNYVQWMHTLVWLVKELLGIASGPESVIKVDTYEELRENELQDKLIDLTCEGTTTSIFCWFFSFVLSWSNMNLKKQQP